MRAGVCLPQLSRACVPQAGEKAWPPGSIQCVRLCCCVCVFFFLRLCVYKRNRPNSQCHIKSDSFQGSVEPTCSSLPGTWNCRAPLLPPSGLCPFTLARSPSKPGSPRSPFPRPVYLLSSPCVCIHLPLAALPADVAGLTV